MGNVPKPIGCPANEEVELRGYGRGVVRAALYLLPMLALICCWGCQQRPRKLNVLIITCDALRPDHLSCNGYERNTSPNIDRLAAEGTLFTQAVCQGTWTVPSLFSLITSTYPHRHRMTHWEPRPLDPSVPSLIQILREHGYRTAFISGHGAIPSFEILRFDTFINTSGKADTVTRMSAKWLRKEPDKPFFLWIHYIEPHAPYGPPPPWDRMFLHDEYSERYDDIPAELIPPRTLVRDTSATDLDYYVAQYDGEIRFVDTYIGNLLTYLTSSGLDETTLVILSADHGESLGEQGRYFLHGGFPYEAVIRVPLILRCKGLIPGSRRIDGQVQLLDVAPTILDLLNLEAPPGLQGISLLPSILREESRWSRLLRTLRRFRFLRSTRKEEGYPSPYAFSEWCSGGMWGAVGIRTEEWKLIYVYPGFTREALSWMMKFEPDTYAWLAAMTETHQVQELESKEPRFLLYNLERDPAESRNLADSEKEVVADLKEKLEDLLGRKLMEEDIDPHLRERLRSLGYIQ